MIKNSAQEFHTGKEYRGFTIIELLIVVSIIGILSGFLLSVIDTGRQKKIAEDTVRRSNIEKLSQALEAFCTSEGVCPTAAQVTAYIAAPTTVPVATYVKTWPTSTFSSTAADNVYNYYANPAASPVDFEVSIKMMAPSPTKYLRYNSVWGKISECTTVSTAATWTTGC